MDNIIDKENARRLFAASLKRGRKDTGVLSRLKGLDNRLLLLSQVLEAVHAGSETYRGIREIRVADIIGTENRGDDFSRDFHPLKHWLADRWLTVYALHSRGELTAPISVSEVGGRYFVRDGHHRVSAARAQKAEFLPALVVSYPLPYHLPPHMDRNQLSLLREKDRFHQRTGVFDILDEREFFVASPDTWRWLEKEICTYNRSWFVRRFGREPESMEEQVSTWYQNLYRNAIEYIRRNSLSYLFPGKRETDIFVEMIRLWNSYEEPDALWLGEIYRIFIARRRRRRLLRTLPQLLAGAFNRLLMSPEEEYRRFIRMSQIEELVPDFEPLPKEKGFYRFLYRQLVHRYAPALKHEYGRAPYIQELTPRWHRELYAPVAAYARAQGNDVDQVRFYTGFCRRYLPSILRGETGVHVALERYSRSTRVRS